MPTKRQRTASRKPAKKRKYTKKEREAAQHVIDATEAVREIHRQEREMWGKTTESDDQEISGEAVIFFFQVEGIQSVAGPTHVLRVVLERFMDRLGGSAQVVDRLLGGGECRHHSLQLGACSHPLCDRECTSGEELGVVNGVRNRVRLDLSHRAPPQVSAYTRQRTGSSCAE